MYTDSFFLQNLRHLLFAFMYFRRNKVYMVKQYSYNDIKTATDGFRRIIENSSNGVSYNAKFRDGQVAVIKEVRVPNDQDYTAFYKEVQLLGRLHHRHIAALYGFFAGRERFLVLEALGNGSLKDHLSDPLKTPLSWTIRLRIAVGIAAALEYLLFFCDPPVSHAYISSSTIMLDENLVPKLSYVSLLTETRSSRLTHSSRQESSTEVDNTPIFQLGLVILELITGQSSEKGQVDLVQWVQESHLVRSMNRMIDPDLGNDYNSREVKCLINAARMCLESVNRTPRYASRILRYLKTQVVTLKAA